MSPLRPLLPLAALLLLAGCELTPDFNDPVRYGPYFAPKNFAGEPRMPADVRRVLVLPVFVGEHAPEETAASLDGIVTTSLQAQQRFEVVTFSRTESRRLLGEREFESTSALPHGMIEQLAGRYAVDAVLFTDLTTYQPVRPQTLGLRCKLVTVRDVRILWTFDETFSASDPAVINSARRDSLKAKGLEPIDRSHATLLSPSRFAAFAADTMFRTLPPR